MTSFPEVAATGNARLSMLQSRVDGISSATVDEERERVAYRKRGQQPASKCRQG